MALSKETKKKLIRPILCKIAELREQYNFTQEQIANELHMTQAAYCKLETGKREFSVVELILLSKFLNMDLGEN